MDKITFDKINNSRKTFLNNNKDIYIQEDFRHRRKSSFLLLIITIFLCILFETILYITALCTN